MPSSGVPSIPSILPMRPFVFALGSLAAITATQGNITTSDIMIDPNSGAITYTGNGAYGRITIQATVDVLMMTFEALFSQNCKSSASLPKNGNAYAPYSEVYAKQKTFQVYTAGNPNSTTITYQLKASSPTDVIEVDSDLKYLVH